MIGRMRPFYQTHWDISKDIKHVWLLFCTYYIAWILGDEGRGEMVTTPGPSCGPSAPGVDPPVCCVLAVTYVRGSFCWLLAPGLQFLSGEGRHHGTGLTSPFCHWWSFGSLPLSPLACLVGDTSFPATLLMWLHRHYLTELSRTMASLNLIMKCL